jgi:hypothetical protein
VVEIDRVIQDVTAQSRGLLRDAREAEPD